MASKKTMEINPHNAIIKELAAKVANDKNDPTVRDLTMLLYESSLLTSGFSLEQPQDFANRLFKLISLGLSIDDADTQPETVEESKSDEPAGESAMESID